MDPNRHSEYHHMNSSDIKKNIASKNKTERLKSIISSLLFIFGVIATAFIINQTIFHSYYVVGTSMVPTLQNNDWLIIEKVDRSLSFLQGKPYIPERGQIVVLDSSIVGSNGKEEQLIKRAIGLPGDTVIVENGTVTIKNAQNPQGFNVDEKLGLNLDPTYSEGTIIAEVGENEVFVLGDNRGRNGSYDSRAFGPIKSNNLQGRLWARLLPINKSGIF
ncbi:MAG TPA: signal peptidase I [Candidatus Saccharimonadales bacterium]|nr:signal peptidase I [Candidatus Saccharimonadales bacterium]